MVKDVFIVEMFNIVVLKPLVLRESARAVVAYNLVTLYWVDFSKEHLPLGAEFCHSAHLWRRFMFIFFSPQG